MLFQRFVEFQLPRSARMAMLHLGIGRVECRDLRAQLLEIEEARLETIVEIGCVVRDFVHQIDQLRFKRRPLVEKILGERRKFRRGIVPRMFDDSLAHLKREIQTREIEIALLELLDDPQRVEIVVEAVAVLAHARIEPAFAGVAERRMPDIVDQRERLDQVGIEIERARHRARDLRHFDRVREPVAEMIGETHGENLRFRFQAAKRARMDHAVAVARVVVSVGMLRFRVAPAARPPHVHCVGCQRHRTHFSASEQASASRRRRASGSCSGFAAEQRERLIGAFGDRRVGVFRFDLRVEFRRR